LFEEEASFRQTPTLHATWARRGSQPQIPTRGERHTQKIFGAVRLDNASFIYLHQENYFQWETYLAFLEQVMVPAFYRRRHRIYLIQDNASYHKKQEIYDWFKANRRYLEIPSPRIREKGGSLLKQLSSIALGHLTSGPDFRLRFS
jgi:hypothetical protein